MQVTSQLIDVETPIFYTYVYKIRTLIKLESPNIDILNKYLKLS